MVFRNQGKKWPSIFFISIVLVLFLLLGVRLFYLQVVKGDYYRGLSSRNHIRVITTPAPRGIVSDRNGVILADSKPAFSVSLVPSEFNPADVHFVAHMLCMSEDELQTILDGAGSVPHRPVVLKNGMTVEDVSPLAENLYRIPGVLIDVAPMRRYHRPLEFCHIVGYVGLANDEESYRGEITGKTGIESTLNDVLRGQPGLQRQVVDALGRVVEEFRGSSTEDPVPGTNIVLTIDAELQRIAMNEIRKTGMPGAVVIVDYVNGDILCAASTPAFDPNMFARGISQNEWNSLLENENNPLFCRAWSAAYPPASTFKIVTAYYLLAENLISGTYLPNPCYGSLRLGNTDFGCWTTHGRLDVVQALAQSCDVFFYRTIQLGTLDDLAEYSGYFGLGSRLTSVLQDEKNGLVPDTDYLISAYGAGGWGLGNLLNVSIGQGELLTTPLQLAVMCGVFASRGSMPIPGILLQRDASGPVMDPGVISDTAFDIVLDGMLQTVNSRQGTLRSTFREFPVQFWGKTGTAECPGDNHALVIGFLREPQPLSICVVVEHGEHGSSVAGPVARAILSEYLFDSGGE